MKPIDKILVVQVDFGLQNTKPLNPKPLDFGFRRPIRIRFGTLGLAAPDQFFSSKPESVLSEEFGTVPAVAGLLLRNLL